MPDGIDIRGRGGRGRFPGPGFPGRRYPIRRFPRFFFYPIAAPRRCEYIDRYGRCCDRYGRCYYDSYRGGYPLVSQDGSPEGWYGMPGETDMFDDYNDYDNDRDD